MAMTKAEMDAFDRQMMGIMDPRAATPAPVAYQPSPPLNDPEGRPLTREYSLEDIRRFLGFGGRPAMSPAEAADAAQMYVRAQAPAPFAPNAPPPPPPPPPPAPPPASIPAPPVPAVPRAAPVRASGARPMGRPGPMPANVEDMSPPAPTPSIPNRLISYGIDNDRRIYTPDEFNDVLRMETGNQLRLTPEQLARPPMPVEAIGIPRPAIPSGSTVPGALPGEASNVPMRASPQQLSDAIRRFGRMDLDPNSFANRFGRTLR